MARIRTTPRPESYINDPNWRSKVIAPKPIIQKTLAKGGMVQQDDYGVLTLRANGMKLVIPQALSHGSLFIPHTYKDQVNDFLKGLDQDSGEEVEENA